MYEKAVPFGARVSPDQVEGQPVYDEGLKDCSSQSQVELDPLLGARTTNAVRAQGCCPKRTHLEERCAKAGPTVGGWAPLPPRWAGRGKLRTHNEVHKRRRGPGQGHIVAITAEQHPGEHAEDHPGRIGEADDSKVQGRDWLCPPEAQSPVRFYLITALHSEAVCTGTQIPNRSAKLRVQPQDQDLRPASLPCGFLNPLSQVTQFPERLLETVVSLAV